MFRRSFGLVLLLGALALAGAQEQERDDTQDTRQEATLIMLGDSEDGSRQVTYNGWPLYWFYLDVPNEAGMMVTLGQAQEGRWYLVTAEGEALDAEEYAR